MGKVYDALNRVKTIGVSYIQWEIFQISHSEMNEEKLGWGTTMEKRKGRKKGFKRKREEDKGQGKLFWGQELIGFLRIVPGFFIVCILAFQSQSCSHRSTLSYSTYLNHFGLPWENGVKGILACL